MLVQAIAIALVLGFVLFETTGLVAGGLVAPGYFALALDRPASIALCLLAALAAMLLVRVASCVALVYGRRRFLLCLLTGFALQWTAGAAIIGASFAAGSMDAVGYIIPGLVAHEMDRQGVGPTLLALLILSAAVRVIMECTGLIRPL